MKKLFLILLVMVVAGCSGASDPAPTSTATEPPPVVEEADNEPEATEPVTPERTEPTQAVSEAIEEAEETVTSTPASSETTTNHARMLNRLLLSISGLAEGREILAEIEETGDTRFVAGLVDVLRFQPFVGSTTGVGDLSRDIGQTLNSLTGQDFAPDWFEWVEWAGEHPEIEHFAGYPGWKGNLYATLIDPEFSRFIYADMKVAPDSRVEEIVWGGVRVDGIPALDNPEMIDPDEADYLVLEERVFGVSINGDTRAYPARFLDWHEMFNDIVGGEPVSLAY